MRRREKKQAEPASGTVAMASEEAVPALITDTAGAGPVLEQKHQAMSTAMKTVPVDTG